MMITMAPGPPPLLLLAEWARDGRVRAAAASALAAMLATGEGERRGNVRLDWLVEWLCCRA